MRALLKVLFIAVLFVSCSAQAYPGGILIAPATQGFSLELNYLTDLGRLYAHSGEINGFGSAFFVFALMLVVMVYGREVVALGLKYSSETARRFVIAGGIVTGLACVLFVAHGIEVGDWLFPYREPAQAVATGMVPIAGALFAAAALIDPDIPGQITLTWMFLTLCVAVYSGVVFWGPSPQTVDGLHLRVRAQQAITGVTLASIVFIVWQTRRALSISEESEDSED